MDERCPVCGYAMHRFWGTWRCENCGFKGVCGDDCRPVGDSKRPPSPRGSRTLNASDRQR